MEMNQVSMFAGKGIESGPNQEEAGRKSPHVPQFTDSQNPGEGLVSDTSQSGQR